VRSFQYAIERLRARPGIAKLVIYKPGPLGSDDPDHINALAEVYRRGMEEVAAIRVGVRTRPS
jgi:hypothetical protein